MQRDCWKASSIQQ